MVSFHQSEKGNHKKTIHLWFQCTQRFWIRFTNVFLLKATILFFFNNKFMSFFLLSSMKVVCSTSATVSCTDIRFVVAARTKTSSSSEKSERKTRTQWFICDIFCVCATYLHKRLTMPRNFVTIVSPNCLYPKALAQQQQQQQHLWYESFMLVAFTLCCCMPTKEKICSQCFCLEWSFFLETSYSGLWIYSILSLVLMKRRVNRNSLFGFGTLMG